MQPLGFSTRYWTKVLGQRLAGLVPGSVGTRINELGSRLTSGSIDERPEAGAYRINRALSNIALAREHGDAKVAGDEVLELGTGWRGADSLLFALLGARRVVTLDHIRWLTDEGLRRSCREVLELESHLLATSLDADRDLQHERLDQIRSWLSSHRPAGRLHDELRIDYRVGRLQPLLGQLRAEGQVFTGFWTESVLQRVPERELSEVLSLVAEQLMAEGAWFFHRTDQRDIHCLPHARTGDHPLRYLSIDNLPYRLLMTGRFISQNRLRESDFESRFRSVGLLPRMVESRALEGDREFVRSLPRIAPQFAGHAEQDLATRASLFIGNYRPAAKSEASTLTIERRAAVCEDVSALES